MRPRKQTHFGTQRPQIVKTPTVTTLLSVKNANSEGLLLKVIERLRNLEGARLGMFSQKGCFDLLAEGIHSFAACHLSGSIKGRLDAVSGDLIGDFKKVITHIHQRNLSLGLASHGSQFPLHLNDLANERLGEFDCL